jgi:hypothetical protein
MLEPAWRAAFEQAWQSHVSGSLAVGAVLDAAFDRWEARLAEVGATRPGRRGAAPGG